MSDFVQSARNILLRRMQTSHVLVGIGELRGSVVDPLPRGISELSGAKIC
jgi:hypothetical protein